jgi:hypothetical protein
VSWIQYPTGYARPKGKEATVENKFELEIHTDAYGGRTMIFSQTISLSTKQLQDLVSRLQIILDKLRADAVKVKYAPYQNETL